MDDFNIGESFEQAFNEIVSFLPDLLGASLLLIIGYFVAKGLSGLTRRASGIWKKPAAAATPRAANFTGLL